MFRPTELPLWFADHTYHLKKIIGTGGMAVVYGAGVDMENFDFAQLVAHHEAPRGKTREHRRSHRMKRYEKWQERSQAELKAVCDKHDLAYPTKSLVAVKILLPGMTDSVPRFEAEWESLLTLNDPNVIQVYGGGSDPDTDLHYYAMELLVGRLTLAEIQDLRIKDKLLIIRQAAQGLGCLHERGIIHRDIKPGNIICCRDEVGSIVAKVADLGIAKDMARTKALTATGQMLGTPNFMAPEQVDENIKVTPLVDVYALGATLYYYSSGKMPYEGKTLVEIFRDLTLGKPPVPLPALTRGRTPEMLAMLIETMMAFTPRHRPPGVTQVVRAIDRFFELAGDQIEMATSVMELPPAKRLRVDARNAFEALLAAGSPTPAPEEVLREPAAARRPSRVRRTADASPSNIAANPIVWVAGSFIAVLLVGGLLWAAVRGSSGSGPASETPEQPPVREQAKDPPPNVDEADPETDALVARTRSLVQTALVTKQPKAARAAIRKLRFALIGRPNAALYTEQVASLERSLEAEIDRLFTGYQKEFQSWLEAREYAKADAVLGRMSELETARYERQIIELTGALRKARGGDRSSPRTHFLADFEQEGGLYQALRSEMQRTAVRQPNSNWALRWAVKSGATGAILTFHRVPKDLSTFRTLALWARVARPLLSPIEVQLISTRGRPMATYNLRALKTSWGRVKIPLSSFTKKPSWNERELARVALRVSFAREDIVLLLDDVTLTGITPDH